jgi:iron complex transport system substrate-binding protein
MMRGLLIAALLFCVASPAMTSQPKHIISLAPTLTETVFALGAGKQLVGVSRFCDRPEQVRKLPRVGGLFDPQLEVILALKPDLVLATSAASHVAVVKELRSRGIQVLATSGDTLGQIQSQIAEVGKALGRAKEAEQLVGNFHTSMTKHKGNLASFSSLKILLVVGNSPIVVAGPGSFADEVLTLIGATSAVPRTSPSWPIWSLENIAQNPPDFIIGTQGTASLGALKTELAPILRSSKLAHTRIIATRAPILQRPGPNLWADVDALVALIRSQPSSRSRP